MGKEPESERQDEAPQKNEGGESDQPSNDPSNDQIPEQEGQSETESVEEEQTSKADELAKVKDQLLRTVAEMENVRRRSQRDVENAHKFAVEKLLGDLLPVLDSLRKPKRLPKRRTTRPAWQKASACRSSCLLAFWKKQGGHYPPHRRTL